LLNHVSASGGGPSQVKLSAKVVLKLNNDDRRFPFDADVVTLTRTLGLKDDSLYLQGQPISRKDFLSKLEMAGFTTQNPFYFVRQGQIAELATCDSAKRLQVVRELTGVRDCTSDTAVHFLFFLV